MLGRIAMQRVAVVRARTGADAAEDLIAPGAVPGAASTGTAPRPAAPAAPADDVDFVEDVDVEEVEVTGTGTFALFPG
jgi:hypothetical protein